MIFFALLRMIAILMAIFSYLVCAIILRLVFWRPEICQPWMDRMSQIHCRWGLQILKIKLEYAVQVHAPQTSALVVSNHLSYLDVLVMMSIKPCAYVTSVEIKETFLLGHLAQLFGCIFVERRNRSNIDHEIYTITDALLAERSVCIFPEATSTNGDDVLSFKKSLFKSAVDSKHPVRLMCIQYFHKTGRNLSTKERDGVCWYGDAGFFSHLWASMCLDGFRAKLSDLDTLSGTENNRDQLCEKSHKIIRAAYISARPVMLT